MPVSPSMADTKPVPEWMTSAVERARATCSPQCALAEAMRAHGEDTRDEALWQVRLDQLDTALLGQPARLVREARRTGQPAIAPDPPRSGV